MLADPLQWQPAADPHGSAADPHGSADDKTDHRLKTLR